MTHAAPNSLTLSLLPIFAVLGVLTLAAPHRQTAAPLGVDTLEVYLPPAPTTDPGHVRQLARLLRTIDEYDHRALAAGAPRPSHIGLAAEYRLIIRETSPGSIQRAGLPLDVL